MILIVLNVSDVENLNNKQDQCSERIFIFGHKLFFWPHEKGIFKAGAACYRYDLIYCLTAFFQFANTV